MGRKAIEIDLLKVEQFASRGLTREQVAYNLGINPKTWQRRDKEKDGAVEQAYLRGKSKGVAQIANALFEKANKGNTVAQIFFLKCNGWKEENSVEVKNTTPIKIEIKNDLKE